MPDSAPLPTRLSGAAARAFGRVVAVRPEEIAALLWSAAYFFFLLAAYYVLRPIRDEMGVAGGVSNLPWLFTGTLVAMLALHTPFAALVARLPRRRFIPITYRFFAVNLLVFYALLETAPPERLVWVGRAFFIWTSVFNLFVVSVFWGMLADVFHSEQGKRLFGFIGVGGTLGGIVGAAVTGGLAGTLGQANLLLVSILLLEVAVQCARRLGSTPAPPGAGAPSDAGPRPGELAIGGSALAGIGHVARSPYLLGICVYMLLFTIGSTVLYFQQADIAGRTFTDRAARTAFFARIDLWVNSLTVVTQVFLTGRIIRLLGVAGTLTLLPALSVVGFIGLGFAPTVAVLVVFQVLRRAGNFAVARPTREVLFTVLSREDKYKAKNLIDTFVYRAGDQIGAWSYAALGALGLALTGIAFVTAPLAAVWLLNGYWLGRRQERLAGARAPGAAAVALGPAPS